MMMEHKWETFEKWRIPFELSTDYLRVMSQFHPLHSMVANISHERSLGVLPRIDPCEYELVLLSIPLLKWYQVFFHYSIEKEESHVLVSPEEVLSEFVMLVGEASVLL